MPLKIQARVEELPLPRLSIATVRGMALPHINRLGLSRALDSVMHKLTRRDDLRREMRGTKGKKQGRLFRNSPASVSVTSKRDRARNFNKSKFNETFASIH